MTDDLFAKVPEWLKSLWHMENELRASAWKSIFLRRDEAVGHLAEARRHLEEALSATKGSPQPHDISAVEKKSAEDEA